MSFYLKSVKNVLFSLITALYTMLAKVKNRWSALTPKRVLTIDAVLAKKTKSRKLAALPTFRTDIITGNGTKKRFE